MICPKCNSIASKLTEEGAYCIRCGFVFYGKWRGKNGLEIENDRINKIKLFLKEYPTEITISELAKKLEIPYSIVKRLIQELSDENDIFLNLIND